MPCERWVVMRIRLGLALLSLLTAACAAPEDGATDLAGSQWMLERIDGDVPATPARARLSFERERLAASAGCNAIGGPWRVEGLRLIAGPLVQTEMYCEGPVWEQEKALSALLAAAPVMTREGDLLTLVSSGHRVRLARVRG